MIKIFSLIWIKFFYHFIHNITKINHFFYCFVKLLHLIPFFSLTRFFVLSYVYISIKSIDCILLSSLGLKEILLISSVKALYLSLLSPCCVKLMYCFLQILWHYLCHFIVDDSFHFQFELLLNSFYDLEI